jgi:uncharacterized protein YprB with RNaseH-like and TPR domain
MSSDLRDRLRQLGVHKGAAKVTLRPKRQLGLEALIEGEVIETDYGSIFIHTERYTPDHMHGGRSLGELLALPTSVAAQLAGYDDLDLQHAVFIDTETTGLVGGTGTLAFLVGLGAFDEAGTFTLQQYFLRSPAEEAAMLRHLAGTLDRQAAVVSFNGRGFDLPLLQTRFTLARLRPRILKAPHLDLLTPSRRVWRGRLPSCALSTLEEYVLHVQREQADVPGSLIPQLDFDYLQTGDAGEMPRVLYHNALDILSMVTLSSHLIQLFDQAAEAIEDPNDLIALGKWHADRGETDQAEAKLRQAIDRAADRETRQAAGLRLASIYKQHDRRAEAIELWKAAALHPSTRSPLPAIDACVELAKYYEWHATDLKQAINWTQRGLKQVDALPDGFVREELAAALTHRLNRLQEKATKALRR